MAEDNLEKFIKNNREAFDDKEPSEGVWKNINSNITPRVNAGNFIWKVAAVLFFCTTSILLYNDFKPSTSSTELAELESYYFTQIDYKRSLMNDLQPGAVETVGIDQELQKLDAMYQVLKDEWKRKPSKKVLEALTLNLLVRLDLLNRQLQSVEDSEDNELANHRSS